MNPRVHQFLHANSNTWGARIRRPAAAVIDPVLDFDPKSGRNSSNPARGLLDHVAVHYLKIPLDQS